MARKYTKKDCKWWGHDFSIKLEGKTRHNKKYDCDCQVYQCSRPNCRRTQAPVPLGALVTGTAKARSGQLKDAVCDNSPFWPLFKRLPWFK